MILSFEEESSYLFGIIDISIVLSRGCDDTLLYEQPGGLDLFSYDMKRFTSIKRAFAAYPLTINLYNTL